MNASELSKIKDAPVGTRVEGEHLIYELRSSGSGSYWRVSRKSDGEGTASLIPSSNSKLWTWVGKVEGPECREIYDATNALNAAVLKKLNGED